MTISFDGRGQQFDMWVPVGESRAAKFTTGADNLPTMITVPITGSDLTFTVTKDATSFTISSPAALPQGSYSFAVVADDVQWFTGTVRVTPTGSPRQSPLVSEFTVTAGPLEVATTVLVGPAGGGGGGGDGTPATTVVAETALNGAASAVGVGTNYAREDHTHGSPPMPSAADVGADSAGTASSAVSTHNALGTAAHGGIVASTDPRLTDTRTPTDGTVTNAKVAADAAIALSKLAVDPLARSNHTGAQAISTVTDLQSSLDGKLPTSHAGTGGGAHANVVAAGAAGFMSGADKSKLDGVETGATADQTNAEIKTAYEANADTNAYTDAEKSKLAGVEAGADVTDTANVTAAGALMDSEVDADIKTLALPASTTISAFGATLVDDVDAATARATLVLGTAATTAATDYATAAQGTDERVPTDGSVTNAKVHASAAIALSKLATDPLARANHTGTQAQSTVTDLTTDLAAKATTTQAINAQTGTTYTLVLADAGKAVTLDNAGAITLTVPPNSSVAFPTGTRVDLVQLGAGIVTVAAGSGVTVNKPAGSTLVFEDRYSSVSLLKTGTDVWVAVGRFADA